MKIHSRDLHAPLRGRFAPNSVSVAHYASFIRGKSPTKFPEWFKAEKYSNLKKLTLDGDIKQNNAAFLKDFLLVIKQRAKEEDIKNIFWDERLAFPNSLEMMNDLDHNDKRWDH